MSAILLIDDNEAYCQQIQKTLALRNYVLQYETDPQKAFELAVNREWDVILLDVVFNNDLAGLELLPKIKQAKPHLPIIMVSAASTLPSAMEAVQKGAFDYLDKPINVERMTMTIEHALEHKRLTELNRNLFNEFYKSMAGGTLSASVEQILKVMSGLDEPWERLLLYGEKGTGKELLAKVLHYKSRRKYGPFISFYCNTRDSKDEERLFTAVSDDGNQSGGKSLIEQADKGTLFIGEISQLSKEGQQRLARFIHENYYMPSAGKDRPSLNIRLIASTSEDLKSLTESGNFSSELFNFLNTLTFRLPPLRERLDDIPLLAEHFLSEMNVPLQNMRPRLTGEALKALQNYHWPGNISELKVVIWLLSFLNRSAMIDDELVRSALAFYKLLNDLKAGREWPQLLETFENFYRLFEQTQAKDQQLWA